MARPLYLQSPNIFREISDANIERIAYWVRTRYANQLLSNGSGAIFVGGTGTTIGSKSDTSSTANINTNSRNYTPGTDYVGAPGTIGSETDATYTYRQNRNAVTAPTNAVYDASGYLIHDGATSLRMINNINDVWTDILSVALTQIKTGDQVGSYRVATASPGAGWTDRGVWFQDTTYSAGTVTYRLYLRTSATALGTAPTANMLMPHTSGVIANGAVITEGGGFVNNILLPLFTNYVRTNNSLNYSVGTAVSGTNRGSFADTRQTATVNDFYFIHPTYYSRTQPTGGRVTFSTHYLSLN